MVSTYNDAKKMCEEIEKNAFDSLRIAQSNDDEILEYYDGWSKRIMIVFTLLAKKFRDEKRPVKLMGEITKHYNNSLRIIQDIEKMIKNEGVSVKLGSIKEKHLEADSEYKNMVSLVETYSNVA